MPNWRGVWLLLGICHLGSCQVPSVEKKLILTGSSTLAPLASELASAFESRFPDVRIDVQSGGSARGISDTRNGLADIGLVSRALKPTENDLIAHGIAQDGISLIVHKENPIATLSSHQIRQIYTGNINFWPATNHSTKQPITVIHKASGRSTQELFLAYFQLANRDIRPDIIIGENQHALKLVSSTPNALAYVSIGAAEFEATQGLPIRLLPIEGIDASVLTLKSQQFPLSRRLNLVTASTPVGLAKQFIEFSQSKEAHTLINKQFFIPIHGY
jgi:phosphate transport system substrate-binding protein